MLFSHSDIRLVHQTCLWASVNSLSARLRIHSYSSRYRYMRLLYTQCPVPPGKVDKITLDKITVLKNITVQSQTGTWTTQIWKKRKKALPYLLQSLGSASLPLSHREAALLLAVAHVWSTGACPNVVPTSLNSFTGAPWTPSRRPIAPLSWQPHTRECRASLWAETIRNTKRYTTGIKVHMQDTLALLKMSSTLVLLVCPFTRNIFIETDLTCATI